MNFLSFDIERRYCCTSIFFFFTGLFLLSYTRRYNEAKKRTFRSLLKIDRLIELDNFRDKIFLRDISSSKVIQYGTICNIF